MENTPQSNQFLQTNRGKTQSNAIEVPSISLPKGGGAIKGIDEKFSVNAVNGTGGFSIPLPFSPARGASPSLSLNYNSGSGNGIFGLGWNLGLSSIKRKTDKGLPQYLDTIDTDVFLFSEAEDLVPEFKKEPDGTFSKDDKGDYVIKERDTADGMFTIRNYRPRIEGLFAKIERWTQKSNGIIKWRVITKENVTSLFGWTSDSVIADPKDQSKIYEWLPEFVFDDKGNCSHYIYKKEDEIGFDGLLLHNRNRLKNNAITYTNLYLEKLLYGNKTPYKQFGDAFPNESDYLFETVFDYGKTDYQTEPIEQLNPWDFRPDAFSDYKAGFEIRTTRLCKRVLLYHHFKRVNEYDGLVRSVNFEYDAATEQDFTFLKSITSYGYIKKPDGSYSYKKLPPMEFEYQKHEWNCEVRSVSPDALVHAPTGIDQSPFQFIDLFNEGLSGILSEQANGWYYKHNLGVWQKPDDLRLMFEPAKLISPKPSYSGLGNQLQLADLDADGGKQLVSFEIGSNGYFELDDDNEWHGLKAFKSIPNIDFGDANTRMLDLNGDGKPEVVISGDNVFTWHPSEGRDGYAAARKTSKPFDEEEGPSLVFADSKQSIYLADMSGDGMTDILRIRNGEVCYWPNLGYGKFGAKVAMDNAPVFDHSDSFNPAWLRLADIDGSGTSDIIFLGKSKFTCWKNLSGNRFSTSPFEIDAFPEIHTQAKITVTDLLGNGVACIVWSSPLPKDTHAPLKYIDLMNSKKPHIMVAYKNNLGKEVSMKYTPSTKFYIEDKLAGKPWVTQLHFPVHCISKTITEDKISGYRFVSEYKYHHGYYDHAEREFRGFGMVEQIDAESFEHWVKQDASNVTEEPLHQEPVISKSWHHTGAFLRKEKILNQFEKDYWYHVFESEFGAVSHPEVALPDAFLTVPDGMDSGIIGQLSADEWREAFRACKGMGLRTETFARDAGKFGNTEEARKKELTPFSVATQNCVIELVQPRGKNIHAVFVVKESEAITYNYERNPEDPRIAHTLNVKFDEYGNVLESASVVYPRVETNIFEEHILPIETQEEQRKTVIQYTQNQFTNDVLGENTHRLRLPSEIKTFELKGVAKSGTYYSLSDFTHILDDAKSDTTFYHELAKPMVAGKAQKRLIEHVRSYFYKNDLTGPLPLGRLESLALPFESYQLAYTPELVSDIFGEKVNETTLTEGKFTQSENNNNWWIRSGVIQFITDSASPSNAQSRFYAPISYTEPFGAKTNVIYDTETFTHGVRDNNGYYLFVKETEDALGNRTSVDSFNFRTLSTKRMKDINGNYSETVSDELGFVKAVAVMGKGNEADDLTGFSEVTDPEESAAMLNFFNAPDSAQLTSRGKSLLSHATSRFVYDLESYSKSGKPAVVAVIAREQHFQKLSDSPVQISFEYSNGIGEVLVKKVQAAPGKAKRVSSNPDGTITVSEIDTSQLTPKQLRWIGNGRVIKNNKDNPVKQYEPYFSVNWNFEDTKELVESGVTPKMYYDAIGRLVKTEMPDGTFTKVAFDPWKQVLWDANDSVLESPWYTDRTNRLIDEVLIAAGKDPLREKAAADKAAKHADTPNALHFDTLGRPVLSVEHDRNMTTGADEFYMTRVSLDIEGNLRSVTDARGNTVMQYKYDMLGNLVCQNSMDAGQRWLLTNILGSPLRTWDERNHELRYYYDATQRPTHSKVVGGDGLAPLDHVFDRVMYGEDLLTANRDNKAELQGRNILGQVIQYFDTGGLIDTPEYDFKGQPTSTTRRLFKKYKEVANWIDANLVDDLETGDGFTFTTETDALGRITRHTAPDKSIILPFYDESGALYAEHVSHFDSITHTYSDEKPYIKSIAYNEKGQRTKVIYGNGVSTKFQYDGETFRLKRLQSQRQDGEPLQDLHYTYDPVGNITHIEDKIAPVQFYRNSAVPSLCTYSYDALYRLTEATGRENNAAPDFGSCDNWHDKPFMQSLNPGDPIAIRTYTQSYHYDAVGNIMEMKHRARGGNWTRGYEYEASNNRLKRTFIGDNGNPSNYTNYSHHVSHGFMEELPHLEKIGWNFKEEVVLTSRQRCTNDNIPLITYYQYDGNGQRIRKITENQAAAGRLATKKEERIYIAGYELYIKHSGTDAGLERVSLGLMDGDHRFALIETRNGVDDGTEKQLVRYQMHNHLGSATLELDDTARVISYEEYHTYGTTAYQAKNATIRAAAKRYRYTSMERDEETGLEYHSARYYLPWLGRWLSADPIKIKGGINVYSYSVNNPLVFLDSTGKKASKGWWFEYSEDNSIFIGNDNGYWMYTNGVWIYSPAEVIDVPTNKIKRYLENFDSLVSKAGAGRTILSRGLRLFNMYAEYIHRSNFMAMIKSVPESLDIFEKNINEYEKSLLRRFQIQTASKFLGTSNYFLQFLTNISKGQGIGEASTSAGFGAYVGNKATGYLFENSKKVGWIDSIINVLNSGFKLAGAPKEVTQFSQVVADATPTSFASSLASNFGRALFNLFQGNTDALSRQSGDLLEGRENAVLQGYAMITAGFINPNRLDFSISNKAEQGDFGVLPAIGNYIADEWSTIRKQDWIDLGHYLAAPFKLQWR
ncbi:SpvB/TcaC N-terminal domain-containing protein [Mariniradius saccharolyticus]|nr:SpvB/TcaC N-terminal domain-containing protein [Mariniradius saccharolyticus]